jgi:hypothetical protein
MLNSQAPSRNFMVVREIGQKIGIPNAQAPSVNSLRLSSYAKSRIPIIQILCPEPAGLKNVSR